MIPYVMHGIASRGRAFLFPLWFTDKIIIVFSGIFFPGNKFHLMSISGDFLVDLMSS